MFALRIESVVPLGRRTFFCIVTRPRPNVRRYLWRCTDAGPRRPGD